MKKLEKFLDKFGKIFNLDDIAQVTTVLLLMCLFEGIGIWVAVVTHNYLHLSIITFVWILLITKEFINKIFFKKLDKYLLKTPNATTLIFCIIFIIIMILSWKYFIGIILSAILAFMIADFNKNKEKE